MASSPGKRRWHKRDDKPNRSTRKMAKKLRRSEGAIRIEQSLRKLHGIEFEQDDTSTHRSSCESSSNEQQVNNPSFCWSFASKTADGVRFLNAASDDVLESDEFVFDECRFRLECTPNGYEAVGYDSGQCVPWLTVLALPQNVDYLHAIVRFVCDEVKYDEDLLSGKFAPTSHHERVGDDVFSVAPEKAMKFRKFKALKQWTIKCFIEIRDKVKLGAQSETSSNRSSNSKQSPNGNAQKRKRGGVRKKKPTRHDDDIERAKKQKQRRREKEEEKQEKEAEDHVISEPVKKRRKRMDDNHQNTQNKPKAKWNANELAAWIGSLGRLYQQYVDAFEENEIDRELMNELDQNALSEIVKNKIHQKKVFLEWWKL